MKTKFIKSITVIAVLFAFGSTLTGCNDHKSYAELLTDETHAVNYFLANHRVVNSIPSDTIFEVGPDAPYYRMDSDGNIYMQVLDAGSRDNKVEDDEQIYFRFTRYNLEVFERTGQMIGEGNAVDLNYGATWFRFNNTTLSSSTMFGSGIQLPLNYLGVDCNVNIVIKSQLGFTEEIAYVQPYLFNIRYYRSPL